MDVERKDIERLSPFLPLFPTFELKSKIYIGCPFVRAVEGRRERERERGRFIFHVALPDACVRYRSAYSIPVPHADEIHARTR